MQPFWKDEPDNQSTRYKPSKTVDTMVKAIGVFMVLAIFGITFALVNQVSHFWAWGVVIYFIVVFGTALITAWSQRRRQNELQLEISQIQQRAVEKAGASLIGSAIHVAGNPHLDREQKIVLVLTKSSIDFYTFDQDHPLDSIPLKQVNAVHTVVYDDNQTPHLDTIDSSAQALQITIQSGDVSYDCLLRNMRKVRPIDWYQAIQKARMQPSGDQFQLDRD